MLQIGVRLVNDLFSALRQSPINSLDSLELW
jgi:hypothetical protein